MVERNSSNILIERNGLLNDMAELSFKDALTEVNEKLGKERRKGKRLALLSAKSWLLRNRLKSAIHDPYIYSINEVENTAIFTETDDEDDDALSDLFDAPDKDVESLVSITILKNTTLNGHKVLKGSIVEVTRENAEKLTEDGKATIIT